MQDVPPGVELFSSHLNCRDISFFWATRGLYVDRAIMTSSGSQPTCFRFMSVGDPDYIYLHFLFERTTITKSYGRTLWQLLQLAKSLTT